MSLNELIETSMPAPRARRHSKSQPVWTDVKAKLAAFDRGALLDLIHRLYAAHKENQMFLHARFGLGEDVLYIRASLKGHI